MSKITFSSLKTKLNTEVKEFDYNGSKIEVLQYLPIEDKISLINIIIQQSKEGNILNPMLLDMYLHTYMVFMYTNITFSEKQKEDIEKTFDLLTSNGILDEILNNIPEEEYSILVEYLEEYCGKIEENNKSVSSMVQSIIKDLPTQAEAAMKIVENFDEEKFANVVNFAKAVK